MTVVQPTHVAIIMDGNGRWATQQGLPRSEGHIAGAQVVNHVISHAIEKEISVLSLFVLSTENVTQRTTEEIDFLLTLLSAHLAQETPRLLAQGVRLVVIGDRSIFSKMLLAQVEASEEQTQAGQRMTLILAVNYSGQWDIEQAIKQVSSASDKQELLLTRFEKALATADFPTPDLLIRTSGEYRISNFMLFQLAYTELFFTPVNWPDFDAASFDDALAFFQSRQRRFGGAMVDNQ
jgi:undecaprenyl diphosphate synthase